jgi:imidazolonepropionase-like amidohydrolase
MVDRGIIHVPTLQLFLGPWFDEYPPPPRPGLADYRGETMADKEKNRVADNFTASREAGVVFAVGSDSFSSTTAPYGSSTLEEVRTMVRIGTPPMDALVAATRNGARALRIDGTTGTLESGKAADLIVLDGNPLEDIAVLDPDRMLLIMRGTQLWKDDTP